MIMILFGMIILLKFISILIEFIINGFFVYDKRRIRLDIRLFSVIE